MRGNFQTRKTMLKVWEKVRDMTRTKFQMRKSESTVKTPMTFCLTKICQKANFLLIRHMEKMEETLDCTKRLA